MIGRGWNAAIIYNRKFARMNKMMTLKKGAALHTDQDNPFGGSYRRRCPAAPHRHHLARALIVSALTAAGLTALTQPSGASNKPASSAIVNRTHKGNACRRPCALHHPGIILTRIRH